MLSMLDCKVCNFSSFLKQDHSHLGFINDRIKKAEKRLEQNPYDVEAWSIIVRDAQVKFSFKLLCMLSNLIILDCKF